MDVTNTAAEIIPGLLNDITFEIMRDIEVFAKILLASPIFARAYGIGENRDETNVMRWQKWCGIKIVRYGNDARLDFNPSAWTGIDVALDEVMTSIEVKSIECWHGSRCMYIVWSSDDCVFMQRNPAYECGYSLRRYHNKHAVKCVYDGVKWEGLSWTIQYETIVSATSEDDDGTVVVNIFGHMKTHIEFEMDGATKTAHIGVTFFENGAKQRAWMQIYGVDDDIEYDRMRATHSCALSSSARDAYESGKITSGVCGLIESLSVTWGVLCQLADENGPSGRGELAAAAKFKKMLLGERGVSAFGVDDTVDVNGNWIWLPQWMY